jgi:hypothetical protein
MSDILHLEFQQKTQVFIGEWVLPKSSQTQLFFLKKGGNVGSKVPVAFQHLSIFPKNGLSFGIQLRHV